MQYNLDSAAYTLTKLLTRMSIDLDRKGYIRDVDIHDFQTIVGRLIHLLETELISCLTKEEEAFIFQVSEITPLVYNANTTNVEKRIAYLDRASSRNLVELLLFSYALTSIVISVLLPLSLGILLFILFPFGVICLLAIANFETFDLRYLSKVKEMNERSEELTRAALILERYNSPEFKKLL